MASGFWSPLAIAVGDGPTLTAAAAATALPITAKFTFPPNSIITGSMLRVWASGRISCVVTTPGTARFDIRLGGTVVYDSGALNLNVVAKVTLPWTFEGVLTCRAVGSAGNFMGIGRFQSEAVVGSAVATAGGNGDLLSAVSGGPLTAPAVGGAIDLTAANAFDFFFTQTVATGSFTIHQFLLESASVAST